MDYYQGASMDESGWEFGSSGEDQVGDDGRDHSEHACGGPHCERGEWAPLEVTLDLCPTCDEAIAIWVSEQGSATIEQYCDACSALLLIHCEDGAVYSVTDLDLERTTAA